MGKVCEPEEADFVSGARGPEIHHPPAEAVAEGSRWISQVDASGPSPPVVAAKVFPEAENGQVGHAGCREHTRAEKGTGHSPIWLVALGGALSARMATAGIPKARPMALMAHRYLPMQNGPDCFQPRAQRFSGRRPWPSSVL